VVFIGFLEILNFNKSKFLRGRKDFCNDYLIYETMINKNVIIDDVDKKILSLLMKNANMPYTEIGKKINVSGGTVHVRMTKMEEAGIVVGSQLVIDHTKLGWDISAFLGIYLDKSSLYEEVAQQLSEIPEVISINYTTGIYSIFAKIVCRDTVHLREVLHDKIQKVQGIQRTETFISLEESLNRPVPFSI
jgi:Lrp/AsnC family transcriptional regulator, regulator for asnA, asnC and gidA